MASLDIENHSPLDWAADTGNVNIMEFFIRKGLNPYRLDGMKRSPLHWAVRNNRLSAARFLVLCGCSPYDVDVNQQSPMQLAINNGNKELVGILKLYDKSSTRLSEQNSNNVVITDPSKSPSLFRIVGKKLNKRSHAIYRINTSEIGMALLFSVLVISLWLLCVVMPFYAWVILIAITAVGFRYDLNFQLKV